MQIRYVCAAALALLATATALVSARPSLVPQTSRTWTLGEDADTKKNPLKADDTTLAEGKAIFKDKCSRCHGPGGLGDGPDGDPELTEMNLTDPKRAARNSDGIVFYKVLNGRGRPKMPAFKDELTEEQIWTVVTYVQTLRRK
jgi:mono/diheme cytochrome c family protein